MRIKIVAACIGILCLGLGASPALGSDLVYSPNEKIKTLIAHSKAGVFFQTSYVCQHWCQVDPSNSVEMQKSQYAMLLAAKMTGSSVTFEWNTPLEGGRATIHQRPSYIMLVD